MPTIFLDMDGVLCDFFNGALEACGLPADTPPKWDFWSSRLTDQEFWATIDQQCCFWEDLHPYSWAQELVAACRKLGPVYFCSSPGPDRDSASGKLFWLRRHGFLQPGDSNYFLTSQKQFLAAEDRLLIDDADSNVSRWQESGGEGLLFPAPWNAAADSLPWVREHKFEEVESLRKLWSRDGVQ